MKKGNESKKRILASLVMGLNCVNSFAPMAVAVNGQPENVPAKPIKETVAEPEQYTAACYQALDVLDSAIFGTAEAAFTENVGTAYATSSVNGETVNNVGGSHIQNISAGGIATSGIVTTGGIQNVYADGTGNLTSMRGSSNFSLTTQRAQQIVADGGTGIIGTLSVGGFQTISAGGTGAVTIASSGGYQIIVGGKGTITSMSASGVQWISSGGTGFISTMSGGSQELYSSATGSITMMSSGTQHISAAAVGSVSTMYSGHQYISSGGTGLVETLGVGSFGIATATSGNQYIFSGGIGSIGVLINGHQDVSSGAKGTISKFVDGWQYINPGGIGSVSTMDGGWVYAGSSNGTGIIDVMNGGSQTVAGSGIVKTMTGGTQDILSRGKGNVGAMSGGTQLVSGAGTITTMTDGLQSIVSGGTGVVDTMNGGRQNIVSGGTGTVAALNGGQQFVSAGGTSFKTDVKGGTMAVFADTAIVESAAIDAGKIIFNGGGANYRLRSDFAGRGGTVDLTVNADGSTPAVATYETLTIDNLSGNGTNFLMDTDLASETNGDKLVIQAAAANAGGTIQVYDKSVVDGNNVSEPKKLLMVTDNSGITTWTGKSLDTGGLWIITPTIKKEGNDWYLVLGGSSTPPTDPSTPTVPTITPNPTAISLTAFSEAAYGTWRNAVTDDTLRMRLGDLRHNEVEEGVWARAKAGKLGTARYDGSYQMYQVGIDKKLANTVYGVAIDHMVGSTDYLTGNGQNSMTNISLYATNYHPSGVYSDVVVKAGKYNGDINFNLTNDAADYGMWGYSASYELGKTLAKANGFFIEPEAQLILGRLQGADSISNKSTSINSDAITSFLGRVGFVAGRKLKDSDYYFKANLWREFAGNGDVHLSAINSFGKLENQIQSTSHKDTWFTLGLGGNVKLARKTHLYGDIEKSFGADIQKKWQVNAGVRWEF